MREAAERRQQLELEHEQALAVLHAKQQEIDLLQKVSGGRARGGGREAGGGGGCPPKSPSQAGRERLPSFPLRGRLRHLYSRVTQVPVLAREHAMLAGLWGKARSRGGCGCEWFQPWARAACQRR